MKNGFLIGEVSKMFDVSIDTLRYYDKLGIVSPKVNKINNYRVYSLNDVYLLSFILGARYLEIPIASIKNFLDEDTLNFDNYLDFMERQSLLLEEKIKYLKNIKKTVNNSKKTIEQAKSNTNIYDFSKLIKNFEKREFYLIPIKETLSKNLGKRFSKTIDIEGSTFEYLTKFNINYESGEIYPLDEIIYIEKKDFSSILLKKFKNSLSIKTLTLNTAHLDITFLGTNIELQNYIKNLTDYFGITCNDVLIKLLGFFKSKDTEVSFVQIIFSL